MNDYNRAIEHHKLALEMNKRLFPGNHKDIALSYFNLGNSYYNMKDYKSAIEHHKLALELRRQLFPRDYRDIANSYNNLGKV